MRPGHIVSGVRNDLFRSGKRHMLRAVRVTHEVRRAVSHHGFRVRHARRTRHHPPLLEAASRLSPHLLHYFRPVGSRRRRLADSSQWCV